MLKNKLIKILGLCVVVGVVASFGYIYRDSIVKLFLPSAENSAQALKAPDGFKISVYAKGLTSPRIMAIDSKGRMAVSEPSEGKVMLIEDADGDGIAENSKVLLEGLRLPHGLVFYTDDYKITYLYVAETHQVARYVYDANSSTVLGGGGQNIANLSKDGGLNPLRTVLMGPNFRKAPIMDKLGKETMSRDKLYIGVGSSCDVCVETITWKYGTILESDPVGSYTGEFAGGLRNSIFFTFHPITKEIWAAETGRGGLGDNLPPDEINIVKVAGPEHKFGARRFGWPFCYGKQVRDTTFNPAKIERLDLSNDCATTEPSAVDLPVRVEPLGLAFIANTKWPKEWQNNLLVAYHSSGEGKNGYKIVKLSVDSRGNIIKDAVGNPVLEDFITGWMENGRAIGKPVDLKFDSTGNLFITDDFAGIIYRISPK